MCFNYKGNLNLKESPHLWCFTILIRPSKKKKSLSSGFNQKEKYDEGLFRYIIQFRHW